MRRIWQWLTAAATLEALLAWIAYLMGAAAMSELLAWATLATIGMWVVLGVSLLCRRIPFFRDWRKGDQLRALAPELEDVLSGTEGVVYARIHNREDNEAANRAYSRANVLLTRLRIEFGISVPVDPYDLALLRTNHKLFAQIVAYAYAGKLKEARQVSGWKPWPGRDSDGPQPPGVEP